jgi:electron transfer flavoprotein alpha subunit
MSGIKRIDPRRPFHITKTGLRRIVLGETGTTASAAAITAVNQRSITKPLRPRAHTERWFMTVVHSDRGRLDEHARQVIAAAAILATPETGVIAVVLGELFESLQPLGADKVIALEDFDAIRYQPETELAVIKALIEQFKPRHVFLAESASGGGDLGRRLIAAHADTWAAHVSEISANHVATSWSGGAATANAPLPRFILLEAGSVDANISFEGTADVVPLNDLVAIAHVTEPVRDLGLEAADAQGIGLEEADVIVSAGNGVRNVATLEALATSLGAAVGASRVAVDDGKFPRDKQIGASGKTVSARTYIAVGISGAVQHLQGIKDCQHVIAINRDAGAAIVKRADLTIVGDAEDVMQALITRVARARAQREMPEGG